MMILAQKDETMYAARRVAVSQNSTTKTCHSKEVILLFYFRENEFHQLDSFLLSPISKAFAIYGRRRAGKTRLITEYIQKNPQKATFLYFQCTSFDYHACLTDFLSVCRNLFPNMIIPASMPSFRDTIALLGQFLPKDLCIIIDEFPFLAKKNDNVTVEFQWIIDHGLGSIKLILSGSNLSFMKTQIGSQEAPLYGRFDEIMEVRPFSFVEVRSLFPDLETAMKVYSMTGGVAQYVMFFLNYSSVEEATAALFFSPDGRLIREAPNILLQELRDPTTYEQILRAVGGSGRSTPQIASQSGLDNKGLFPYLNRLENLQIISQVTNPLSSEKRKQRFRITDALFRFHYTFIEPNMSLINSLREKAMDIILDHRYQEFVGITYEDIIRENCFQYALDKEIPFMPRNLGKWWGPVYINNSWQESEVDVIAFDDYHLLVGECKYRSKATGMQELDNLKLKAQFIPSKDRELFYLLASKSGFTEELLTLSDSHLILINQF